MNLSNLAPLLRRGVSTLKFRIVAMVVLTSVISAELGAELGAELVLHSSRAAIERQLPDEAAQRPERRAGSPQAVAPRPLAATQREVWLAISGLGLAAALFGGLAAWHLTRPISRLRACANQMLAAVEPARIDWPLDAGEMGDLARAFQQVGELRQRRENDLNALLQQLDAVLEHAEVGIALSRDGRFELVSHHFCRIFRCEKHEAQGQTTHMVHASDQAYEAFSERARPAFMQHGAFDGELELMRRTGQTFWAHMRGRAVVPGDRSKGTIWIIEDVTEVREHRERLAWASSHDSLTGLANRAAFEHLLGGATAAAGSVPFCALFIDLDRFKQVNDSGGHAAGDALLRDIAQALAAQVRQSDTVARLGGDEFAVLLPRCPLERAGHIAEQIRAAVADYRLNWEGQQFGVGASIGLVPVDGSYTSAAEVLRAADTACYAAKRQGRNCVAIHGAPPAAPPSAAASAVPAEAEVGHANGVTALEASG